jgi:DNA-binding transcriptional ArsR family regulator
MDADIRATGDDPTEAQVAVAVQTLRLLGDATRLRVLWCLLEGEHSVGGLAARVGARPTTVSQHLAKLHLARLVHRRRDGIRIYYTADNVHVRQLVHEALHHADHVAQGLPDHGPA